MTNKQLNAAVKKFVNDICNGKIDPLSEQAKAEFQRLYGADKTLQAHNKESIRMLLRLNIRYIYEPLYKFGMQINMPDEK